MHDLKAVGLRYCSHGGALLVSLLVCRSILDFI